MDIHDQISKYSSLISQLQHKKDELIKECNFCTKCKRYYLKSEAEHTTETVKQYECVYQDAGYGDDDEYAEVERLVNYDICPVCGQKEYKSSIKLRQGPSKRRWE